MHLAPWSRCQWMRYLLVVCIIVFSSISSSMSTFSCGGELRQPTDPSSQLPLQSFACGSRVDATVASRFLILSILKACVIWYALLILLGHIGWPSSHYRDHYGWDSCSRLFDVTPWPSNCWVFLKREKSVSPAIIIQIIT